MTTFDTQEVREITAAIGRRLDACDNGEGMECATLDALLKNYANECRLFCEKVSQWGRGVFAGRIPFDSEVERMWVDEGKQLYQRAFSMWSSGSVAESTCYGMDGPGALQAALWQLYHLVYQWVSPKLSIGPSARLPIANSVGNIKEIEQRVAGLPPLPEHWEPADQKQRAIFRKKRSSLALGAWAMSESRAAIPLTASQIELGSIEFATICAWPFEDDSLGYGTSILQHLVGEAAVMSRTGCCADKVFLEVYTTSTKAISLYTKAEFHKITDEIFDPSEKRSYVVMAKRVSPAKEQGLFPSLP